jgi:hypothetical protein
VLVQVRLSTTLFYMMQSNDRVIRVHVLAHHCRAGRGSAGASAQLLFSLQQWQGVAELHDAPAVVTSLWMLLLLLL